MFEGVEPDGIADMNLLGMVLSFLLVLRSDAGQKRSRCATIILNHGKLHSHNVLAIGI